MLLPLSRSPVLLGCLLLVALAASNGVLATPSKAGFGYKLVSLVQLPHGGGLVGYLQVKQRTSTYGPDIPRLRLFVKHETRERVRVQITDAEKQRWEVPYNLLPREPAPPVPGAKLTGAPFTAGEYPGEELVFTYGRDPFWFAVHRKSTRQPLFNTSAGPLVFKDQYIEASTSLPRDAALYGLGENTQPGGIRLRPNDPYTIYTTDISAINLNTDLYGSHPVYMDLRSLGGRGVAHAVLLLNSNGMDVFYKGTSLKYKVIGGLLDFYFFAGPTPLAVVDQYTSMIGRPAPMPYWAFGFHQCRWGYKNLSVVEGVVEGYRNAQIPLDVIWNDDDHMDAAKDFTLDPVNYPRPKLLAFLDKIHAQGMKYIVLIDPGIAVNNSYGVYQRGMARDIFIKLDGQPYLAQVWPGPVYFPDFLNPNGVSWWIDEVRRFHDLVPVDGLWIDMNEASNFCTGKCEIPKTHACPIPDSKTPWVCCLDCKNLTNTRWDEPPYKINASGQTARLGFNTIATQRDALQRHPRVQRAQPVRFLAGHRDAQSSAGLQGKRPFILTRSTFVGSGAYAAHWTGDNKGTWENLRYSISPPCSTSASSACRWSARTPVGSTLRRRRSSAQPVDRARRVLPVLQGPRQLRVPRQELYVWESVAKSARNALGMRYRLLPYLYTLNYQAHLTGAPVARPVFFSFPDFAPCYGLSTQFLLGKGVMVSPVLEEGATSVNAVFPAGKLRGGVISKDARATPFTLVVAFPFGAAEADAEGDVYVDDDERPEMVLAEGQATYVRFFASVRGKAVTVRSEVHMGSYSLQKGMVIEKVSVLGLEGTGRDLNVQVEGADSATAVATTSPYFAAGDNAMLHRHDGVEGEQEERLGGGGRAGVAAGEELHHDLEHAHPSVGKQAVYCPSVYICSSVVPYFHV
ncbi:hypothetical protein PR202_ga23603 [Eleusine coracana subsp. coracana]|uniref:Alpha-glucosidase n=1 Tax=Eleusine coracana subsp. coracana TaxID=191504 RepID=A0AAV5D692_ELECO|nr:hypothetical protein PR202_ga23603 [Eleusine coracana subsp. coracana]